MSEATSMKSHQHGSLNTRTGLNKDNSNRHAKMDSLEKIFEASALHKELHATKEC